jgi:aminoglycoside 2'-N-acetyltransferase I
MTIRVVHRDDLKEDELDRLLELCSSLVDGVGPTYWSDIGSGTHVILEEKGEPVSHASVVPLELHAAGRSIYTGYVEAVCTRADRQHKGFATKVMSAVAEHLASEHYLLGGLSASMPGFYTRLGWEPWRGTLWVRTDEGVERTRDAEGSVFVLRTAATPRRLYLDAPLSAPRRPTTW